MLTITSDLLTYIEGIDIQHINFIDCMNIIESIEMIPDIEVQNANIVNAFDFLSTYITEHFGYEEELMKKNNYPKYREHRELHKRYIVEVDSLKAKCGNNAIPSVFTQSLDDLITNWGRHIETSDKAFGQYLLCKR